MLQFCFLAMQNRMFWIVLFCNAKKKKLDCVNCIRKCIKLAVMRRCSFWQYVAVCGIGVERC